MKASAQKNQERFLETCKTMKEDGYILEKKKLSKLLVSVLGILVAIPFAVLIGGLFRLVLMERANLADITGMSFRIILIAIMVVSVIIHEYIHGIAWSVFCRKGWKSIDIQWSFIMPACHCDEPLAWWQYVWGVMMPVILLGGLSLIFLIALPGTYTLLTATINVVAAGGDLLILLMSIKYKKDKIYDLPVEAGFAVFKK